MGTRHSEAHQAAHEAFNSRDYDELARLTENLTSYVDHATGLTVKSGEEFVRYLQETWVRALSDAA